MSIIENTIANGFDPDPVDVVIPVIIPEEPFIALNPVIFSIRPVEYPTVEIPLITSASHGVEPSSYGTSGAAAAFTLSSYSKSSALSTNTAAVSYTHLTLPTKA